MADTKYEVGLSLPGGSENVVNTTETITTYMSMKNAGLIPRSVRLEITKKKRLPDAPSKELVEACLLLADISGFTALGEKLTKEYGDAKGAEEFAAQMSTAISALVNVTHRYEGEVVKIAGDCLICVFGAIPTDPEDRGDEKSFERAKECSLEMLKIIKTCNEDLDLHGGLAGSGTLQRLHLKELRGSSPRSNTARQRMKKHDETTMSRAEFERRKQRWFLIAGRPLKIAAGLLDRAKAGTIKVYGGLTLTRETNYEDINDEEENEEQMQKRVSKRGTMIDTYTSELAQCPEIASAYLPPIVRAKGGNARFENERRRVVIVFLSLPNLAKESTTSQGVNESNLNDVYSALRSVLAKFEGQMRDFLFEDKGCTLIACFGITRITEVDALRAVLFALEASSACSSLSTPCKIGISMGQCFTGICGHPSRCDFVVMGAETNMAARLMGKAALGKILVSERVYNATQNYIGYDMSNPIEVKGKDGVFRALCPYGRRAGAVRHKNQDELDKGVFVGRETEMTKLRAGLKAMLEEKKGSAYILEGLAGMGKSAIVWQLQREAIDDNVRFLMGTGSAIEKQTPYFAFSQILTAAANLSTSPSYGEVLALKFNHGLEEEDLNALGIILPQLAKLDATGKQIDHGRLEARAAQVCLKIFQSLENTIFVFEDAHWIDSQSWLMLQMVLPQLSINSIVMIVTRPPNMISQQKAGGADAALKSKEEKIEEEWLEDDDRIKFSRILAALKENSNITLMELGTMDHETMKTLIGKTLDVDVDKVSDDFVKLMDQKAGGIPMYLSSMTNWLKERDLVNRDENGNILFTGDIKQIKFPSSIMDTVHERIDSLDEEAKVLIKVCACFGFEFRQAHLVNVAPQFLSSQDLTHLHSTLETLAARGLVVAVTGESVSKMMKFTHQIITECAHNLMLESQRQQVHRAIVEEYENSSVKYEMDVLAFHWLRSGDVERGCDMLTNAAIKALDIGAFKECVNSLSQAIAYSKEKGSKRTPYWTALLGYARYSYGDRMVAARTMWEALHQLNDPEFLPTKKSQISLDKMMREYGELGDIPTKVDGAFSEIDKTKVLITVCLIDQMEWIPEIRSGLKDKYGIETSEDLAHISEWYRYYGLLNAYKQNDIDSWTLLHIFWPMANNMKMLFNHPEQVQRTFRRCTLLSESTRLRPQYRSTSLRNAFTSYLTLAPEAVQTSLQRFKDILPMIDGNLKFAFDITHHINHLSLQMLSLADVKSYLFFVDRVSKVRFDSEALIDQKATAFEIQTVARLFSGVVRADVELMRKSYEDLQNMGELFPNTQQKFPTNQMGYIGLTRGAMYSAYVESDWNKVKTYMETLMAMPKGYPIMMPFMTHIEIYHSPVIIALLGLDVHEPSEATKKLLITIRANINSFANMNPGVYRCSMQAYVARITLHLADRSFAATFKKLEESLQYATELECLPMDVLILKCEIARWKGDIETIVNVISEFEKLGYQYQVREQNIILEKLKSGEYKTVDLSFEPAKPEEEELSDEDRLAEIEKAIMDIKNVMRVASSNNDNAGVMAARTQAKALKKQKKALIKTIEEKKKESEAGKVDQAVIDELRAKIAEANERAIQAFDDDDDEAEEAATNEAAELRNQLEALIGPSIPKKKLQDAQNTDAALN